MVGLLLTDRQSLRPLSGVEIKVSTEGGDGQHSARTDPRGHAKVRLAMEASGGCTLTATKEGYLPARMTWVSLADTAAYETIALEPATLLGGVVTDENNQPVSGAKVVVTMPGEPEFDHSDGEAPFVTTGPDGRWNCKIVPADVASVLVEVQHPEFVHALLWSGRQETRLEDLLAQKHVCRMKKGIRVRGTVLDSQGAPIPEASVFVGESRGRDRASTKTDAHGAFETAPLEPGNATITVTSPLHAPDMKTVQVKADMTPVEFRLQAGRRIKGRVVDKAQRPVARAAIRSAKWKGKSTLGWKTTTDSDGRFEWDAAPPDDISLDIEQHDYMADSVVFSAGTNDQVVTLDPGIHVHGRAVDAEAGKPLTEFEVTTGSADSKDGPIEWNPHLRREFRGGAYDQTIITNGRFHFVAIEAKDCKPVISEALTDDQIEVTRDVRLEKQAGPRGFVKLADGSAAEDAEVALCTYSYPLRVVNGVMRRYTRSRLVCRTDSVGRFAFECPLEPFSVLVLHKDGFASVSHDNWQQDLVITLTRWGKVEGLVRSSGKPVGDQQITLSFSEDKAGRDRGPTWQYETTSDKDGRFSFDRVQPGYTGVTWVDESGVYRISVAEWVKSGTTAQVILAEPGRPVHGRVGRPAAMPRRIPWYSSSATLTRIQPEASIAEALLHWIKRKPDTPYSEPGRAYYHGFRLSHDGTFRIEDVGPGTYRLDINVYEESSFGPGSKIGTVSSRLTIPAGQPTTAPFDAGQFKLKPSPRLVVGQPVPGFDVQTLDGHRLTLAELRGRVVLLDFWATWCIPCVVEMPALRALHDTFGKSGLTIVGLSLDDKIEAPTSYVSKHRIPWQQGFLGEWSTSRVAHDYDVQAIPASFLIDREGRLLVKHVHGANLRAALEKVFRAPPSSSASVP